MLSIEKLFASADGFFLLGVRNYLFVRSTNTSTAAFDRMRKIRTAEGGGGGGTRPVVSRLDIKRPPCSRSEPNKNIF